MELFELLGTIAVENGEAIKALQKTQQEGEKTGSKLGKVFSAMGKGAAVAGKAIASGLAVGATAMAGLTVKALQASGDLEQNMGGAEAVFGELGKTIGDMKTPMQVFNAETGKVETQMSSLETVSKEAYKNMGLSQSDYLATANKMGALFKGAGFETQEALDLSSQAMQRAADVASIMGIDTEAAMEAVAGAAKGNFTMMDNLGVAMNDTAIAAYAQSKGINKATSEMSQQEKIGLAMEMFLDKTSYAAGNYAKENETLAGSLGTAKSALTNFLAGSGDVDSLVSSFSNLANVVVNSLKEIAPRLTQGISDLVQQVAPLIAPLLQTLLPVLVDGAVSLVNGLVAALPGIISALLEAIPALIDGILQIADALIGALPQIIQALVSALPTLIPQLIDGIVSLILMLVEMLPQIIQPLIDSLPTIIISIVEALVNNLPALIEGLIQLTISLVMAIPQIIQALVDAIPTVVSLLIQALFENLPAIITGLIQVVLAIVIALPQIFISLIEGIINIFIGIFDGIKNIFSLDAVGGFFGDIFSGAWEIIKQAWSGVTSWFSQIWDAIKRVFSAVGKWFADIFKGAWNGIKQAWSVVGKFFSGIWDGIKNTFKSVGSWFKNIFKEAWDSIKNVWSGTGKFFSGIWDGIKNAFSKVADWFGDIFGKAWAKVKNVFSSGGKIFDGIKEGIVSTFKTVVNGIIKGINKVVSLPFKGLNKILDKIHGIKIAGVKPFKWLTWRAPVPQLPMLEEGGVLEKGQIGLLEGNGAEAVVPLDQNKKWIGKTADAMLDEFSARGVFDTFAINAYKNASDSWIKPLDQLSYEEKISRKVIDMARKGALEVEELNEKTTENVTQNTADAAQQQLDTLKEHNEVSLAEESAYWNEVKNQYKEGTDARIQADKKYLEAKQALDEKLLEAEQTLQDSLGEIYQKLADRRAEILGTFSLFEEYTEGNAIPKTAGEMMNALDSQIASLEAYDDAMATLESRIGGTALFEELSGMGIGALSQIQQINSMNDIQLKMYTDKYAKRTELATKMAKDELSEETFEATQKAYQTFADTCSELGIEVVSETTAMQQGVTNALDKIKQAFETFQPKMKMPHFKIEGTLDIEAGSVPSVAVEWYKKAMSNAAILNKPTIFGYSASSGKYLGGGEAGNEVVAGEQTLMNMIQGAVATQNSGIVAWLQKVFEILAQYFPQMLDALESPMAFDSNSMAAALAVPMNRELGRISSRKDRGR